MEFGEEFTFTGLLHVSKMYPTKDTVLQMITACRTIPQNKHKDTPNPLLKKLFS